MPEGTEDKTVGGVTWHATDPDGGPDVGISIYLGDGSRIWCGEISSNLFADCGADEHFDSDGGWFIVWYHPKPAVIAKCANKHDARDFLESFAWLARQVDPAIVTKTMGAPA